MKKLLFAIIIFTAFSSFVSISSKEIIDAIKSGNAAEVAKYFDNTVEITLPGTNGSYSKSKAELVLRDFFAQNAVKSFQVIHQSENAGSQFCIGNLITSTGSFRTTIYMKQTGSKELIQELRFEK